MGKKKIKTPEELAKSKEEPKPRKTKYNKTYYINKKKVIENEEEKFNIIITEGPFFIDL